MNGNETIVEQRLIQTRSFPVRDLDFDELMQRMKRERFSGKLTVNMNRGGVNAVMAEESKPLAEPKTRTKSPAEPVMPPPAPIQPTPSHGRES